MLMGELMASPVTVVAGRNPRFTHDTSTVTATRQRPCATVKSCGSGGGELLAVQPLSINHSFGKRKMAKM
ncbi:hypothetical protein HanPI659440_Chr10g0391271 [Helianthus annuus]|nr:hypothetical protein HanPI659440_Chr10g0391271 [Helianthus annuus]